MAFDFPNIDPVAFSIGPLDVRWYSLAYILGFLGGWRYALHLSGLDQTHRPNREDIDDFLPWAILGVIVGGRLGYVIFYHFDLFMFAPLDILKVWQGGMSFHGGAIGVIIALLIYPFLKKMSCLRLADIVCACVPIGLFFGRIANFINGELYGRMTNMPWGVKFPAGGNFPRHPSQLYEAVLEGAVLFILLYLLIKRDYIRNRPGIVSGAFLAGYGVFRSIVEFARMPDEQLGLFYGLVSMGQILSVPMIIAGLGLISYAVLRKQQA